MDQERPGVDMHAEMKHEGDEQKTDRNIWALRNLRSSYRQIAHALEVGKGRVGS
jgi:hypothetical protein